MASTISSVTASIILFFLVIAVLLLFAYGLYEYELIGSWEANVTSNPYCARTICASDATQPPIYQLLPANDPTRIAYESLSYCAVNAPPCELISAVGVCSGLTGDGTGGNAPTVDQLTQILSYYNNEYYPRCYYKFGGGVSATTNPGQGANVNNPTLVNGPNDSFLVSLLACSLKNGLGNNPDYQALSTACGSACAS